MAPSLLRFACCKPSSLYTDNQVYLTLLVFVIMVSLFTEKRGEFSRVLQESITTTAKKCTWRDAVEDC